MGGVLLERVVLELAAVTPAPGSVRRTVRPRRGRGPRLLRVLSVVVAVTAVLLTVLAGWGTPHWYALPLLASAVAAAELTVVHLRVGRQRWTFSLTEAVLAAALVLAPGAWTVLAVTTGVAAAQLARHQPRLKVQYNLAQFAGATSAAALCTTRLDAGGPVVSAALGVAAFFVVNHLLVGVAVSLTARRGLLSVLGRTGPMSALHVAGNASIGLLGGWLSTAAPVGLAGLAVPLVLLWCVYDAESRRTAEARLYAELAAGQERATARSLEGSAQAVVTAAARSFGGADVELLLVTPEGVLRLVGDEQACSHGTRVGADAFDATWVLRALSSGRVSAGVDADGRPWCGLLIGPRERPQAVLRARRPRGAGTFGRREVRLAEVLTAQAETWLSVAELTARRDAALRQARLAGDAARTLGDLGAHTVPSLLVLREAAGRLARLADVPAGVDPLRDIVEELQAVERAVASLLGAVTLAAEAPDLGVPAGPSHLALPDALPGPAGPAPAPRDGTLPGTAPAALDDTADDAVRLGSLPAAVWS